jgi:hypothetical protein
MSATPDSTFTNPEQLIADLQRQLAECRAERDEALAQQTATAEVLQVINSSLAPESFGRDFNQDKDVDLAAGQQLYVKIVSLESWGVSVSGSKNFERDAFYAWLISPEVAQAEIARGAAGFDVAHRRGGRIRTRWMGTNCVRCRRRSRSASGAARNRTYAGARRGIDVIANALRP